MSTVLRVNLWLSAIIIVASVAAAITAILLVRRRCAGRRLLQRLGPRRGRLRRPRDGVLGPSRLRHLPRLHGLRLREERSRAGGAHRRPAVRDGRVLPAGLHPPARRAARLLRTRGGERRVAAPRQLGAKRCRRYMGHCALPDAQGGATGEQRRRGPHIRSGSTRHRTASRGGASASTPLTALSARHCGSS